MPPKKRSRSSSPSETTAPPTNRTIGNRTVGKVVRSPEALAAMAESKSKEAIWGEVLPFERITKKTDFDPENMFKFITWNVAGLRGILKKNPKAISDFLSKESPDILALQETKLNTTEAEANAKLGVVEGYTFVDHPCRVKKGYSGTRTYVKTDAISVALKATHTKGFNLLGAKESDVGDEEGRILSTFLDAPGTPKTEQGAHPNLVFINTYVPNSGMTLDRLAYRTEEFDISMRNYLVSLKKYCTDNAKAVKNENYHGLIWTGDLNVAERDFDRYYSGTFKTMQCCSGFTPEERESFRITLKKTDTFDVFRFLYPNAGPVYTFWSARLNGRDKGLGWRIDYFVVSENLKPFVVDCFVMPEIVSSDHSPVQLWLRKK
ncbi:AP endonuclease 1 [Angomonas deanei]|nr:AP endonuclease 1 [Angomonas deanei]|eukprot:EPY27696.1 AP endonuclease 1 [Angomonas deanei]